MRRWVEQHAVALIHKRALRRPFAFCSGHAEIKYGSRNAISTGNARFRNPERPHGLDFGKRSILDRT